MVEKNEVGTKIVSKRDSAFNEKKEELKKFSTQIPTQEELPSVPTRSGFFGIFKYKVTGEDFNELTDKIQERMIDQNKAIINIMKEFSTIYDTFSALDKDYIQRIMTSLDAARIANKKANDGLKKIKKNQTKLKKSQEDISAVTNQQKQIIQVLKSFKEKLETLKHLEDVDQIYTDIVDLGYKAQVTVKKQERIQLDTEEMFNQIKEQQKEFFEDLEYQEKAYSDLLTAFIKEKEAQAKTNQTVETKFVKQEQAREKAYSDLSDAFTKEKEAQTKTNQTVESKFVKQEQAQEKAYSSLSATLTKEKEAHEKLVEKVKNNQLEFETVSQGIHLTIDKSNSETRMNFENIEKINLNLTKKLKYTQIFSISSCVILLVLIILIITGVIV
ncbi:MAG: hypothetical protein ACK5NA_11960 [Enterococcus sp.]